MSNENEYQEISDRSNAEYAASFADGQNFFREFVTHIFKGDADFEVKPEDKESIERINAFNEKMMIINVEGNRVKSLSGHIKERIYTFLNEVRVGDENGERLTVLAPNYLPRTAVDKGDVLSFHVDVGEEESYCVDLRRDTNEIFVHYCGDDGSSKQLEILRPETNYLEKIIQFIYKDFIDKPEDVYIPKIYKDRFEDDEFINKQRDLCLGRDEAKGDLKDFDVFKSL